MKRPGACAALALLVSAPAFAGEDWSAQVLELQERAGREILLVLVGPEAARHRQELEAAFGLEPVRVVETAGGGWVGLEARRLLQREGLECGASLRRGRHALELELMGDCEPRASALLEIEPGDPALGSPEPPAPEGPRQMSLTQNLFGWPLFFRSNMEFRLGPHQGLQVQGMFSALMATGLGVGYRVYPVGDFERGLQLGVELGGIWTFYHQAYGLSHFEALMVGGKTCFDNGFTLELQAGVAMIDLRPMPNLNLSIGGSTRWRR